VKNITLISDYGNASHYAAAIKGVLHQLIPNMQTIDISHSIEKFNKLQAAFVLKTIYQHFADGTIHLICIDANIIQYEQIIIAKLHNQYFIAIDNGVLNLVIGQTPHEIWIINTNFYNANTLFPEKEIFPKIAHHLLANLPLNDIAHIGQVNNQLKHPDLQTDENGITAQVVFIDGFGNAIVNVNENEFELVRKGRNYKIFYARKEYFSKIVKHYKEVKLGSEAIMFNSDGFLEIATNEGNASQLLGLRVGSKIIIEFL
jgi:hypothetical protein